MEFQSKTRHEHEATTLSGNYKAALLRSPQEISYLLETVAPLSPDQLLVRMQGCGLCASNIPVWEGREWFDYPLPAGQPGHEGWGVVEHKGSNVSDFNIGDRVALLSGNAFAEYVSVAKDAAVRLPKELKDIPFPGEALGCLMTIMDRAKIHPGQTVAVLGLGFIGLGLLQLLASMDVTVVALSRREMPLKFAEKFTRHSVKAGERHETVQRILEATSGNHCDVVIECTGHQQPLDVATDILATYGKLVIAGYHQDGLRHVDLQKWNWKAIDVVNAHERDVYRYRWGVEAAVEATLTGRLQPKELMSHAYPFSDLGEGLRHLAEGGEDLIKSYVFFS